jgi:hypothetical protein
VAAPSPFPEDHLPIEMFVKRESALVPYKMAVTEKELSSEEARIIQYDQQCWLLVYLTAAMTPH